MAPPSQKYRPIGFLLAGGGGPDARFDFAIRPEELSRFDPSRSAVQQTLGGAWLDSFGAGVSGITISGHNGWRGGAVMSGEALFHALHQTVFTQWHARRATAAQRGLDPNGVTLTFSDALDGMVVLVSPRVFTLHRSRSSPLLMRYRIELEVLADASAGIPDGDPIVAALSNPARAAVALDSMGNAIGGLNTSLGWAQASYNVPGSPVVPFLAGTIGVASAMQSALSGAAGLVNQAVGPILALGAPVIIAARTAFQVEAQAVGLAQQEEAQLMGIARGFNDLVCALESFSLGKLFRSFADLYGASGCSSTAGGLPSSSYALTGANPFLDLFTQAGTAFTASPAAQAAIGTLQGDPLLLAQDPVLVHSAMGTIARQVSVAA